MKLSLPRLMAAPGLSALANKGNLQMSVGEVFLHLVLQLWFLHRCVVSSPCCRAQNAAGRGSHLKEVVSGVDMDKEGQARQTVQISELVVGYVQVHESRWNLQAPDQGRLQLSWHLLGSDPSQLPWTFPWWVGGMPGIAAISGSCLQR